MIDVRRLIGPSLLPTLLLLAGCGSSGPTVVPVHGKVTWKGQPLDSGTVVFHQVNLPAGELRRPAMALLKPDGTFRLSSLEEGDGVLPGRYAVSVQSLTGGNAMEFLDANSAPTSRIPHRYGSPETSGLTAKIAADAGAVELQFDLVP